MKRHKLPKGFLASGIHCGLKKKRKDLSLFYSERVCKAAALFTRNTVKAAPVVLAQEQLQRNGGVRAVVVNSGNANCMTGRRGMADARKMASKMAELLAVPEDMVLVSSTGIIGEFMDMKPVLGGMGRLTAELSRDGVQNAAEGIVTTDKFIKVSSRTLKAGGKKITITGVAKGAGMIDPSMATMLCYVFTDADISRTQFRKALADTTDISFNAITVDGDMSTNDTMLLLANGAAGNRMIKEGSRDSRAFQKKLDEVTSDLARMIVEDGEGASKFIEVRVSKASSALAAKRGAKAIADSLLVKCAVLGGDPNWGRIASSIGASGIKIDTDKMEIILDGVAFFRKGKALAHMDRKKSSVFKKKNVLIEVRLNLGKGAASIYTCDISKKYIMLNSYYTT